MQSVKTLTLLQSMLKYSIPPIENTVFDTVIDLYLHGLMCSFAGGLFGTGTGAAFFSDDLCR